MSHFSRVRVTLSPLTPPGGVSRHQAALAAQRQRETHAQHRDALLAVLDLVGRRCAALPPEARQRGAVPVVRFVLERVADEVVLLRPGRVPAVGWDGICHTRCSNPAYFPVFFVLN